MSSVYEVIGRAIVRLTWMQYGRRIRIAGAVGLVAIGVAGWFAATREPPEG